MEGEKKNKRQVIWPVLALLFFILFILSLSLHLWGLKPWGTTFDYQKAGSWADFVTGLGTMCAALVAFGGIYLESHRARAAEQALENKFNTQIYCWLEPRNSDGSREWVLYFENNVGVPIYRWSISLLDIQKELTSVEFGPLRPKSSQMIIEELRGADHASIPRLRLTFADPTGAIWTRTEEGQLLREDDQNLKPLFTQPTKVLRSVVAQKTIGK